MGAQLFYNRYVAHWFLGSSNQDQLTADNPAKLVDFVVCRIKKTTQSKGGISICVADLKSHAQNPWGWKMEAGGKVTYNNRLEWSRKFNEVINRALKRP